MLIIYPRNSNQGATTFWNVKIPAASKQTNESNRCQKQNGWTATDCWTKCAISFSDNKFFDTGIKKNLVKFLEHFCSHFLFNLFFSNNQWPLLRLYDEFKIQMVRYPFYVLPWTQTNKLFDKVHSNNRLVLTIFFYLKKHIINSSPFPPKSINRNLFKFHIFLSVN